MTPLQRITERVTRLGHPDDPATPRCLLTIAEFFDGNTHEGSIGCNLEEVPPPATFRALFEQLASRPDVFHVRIEICMFDDPEWPFSDTVWFMTSASVEEVRKWFPDHLAPDDVTLGWPEGVKYEPYEPPSGVDAIAAWWD